MHAGRQCPIMAGYTKLALIEGGHDFDLHGTNADVSTSYAAALYKHVAVGCHEAAREGTSLVAAVSGQG